MDAMEMLLGRSSATLLSAPGPTEAVLEQMIRSALRAPDHGRLRPWKFVVVREQMRGRFGEILAQSMKRKMPEAGQEVLQRERDKAMRAPMIIVTAYTAKPAAKIPVIEQMMSAGAATQNIMLAAHALGYGAMWKTGDAAYDDDTKRALGLEPADQIIGFLYIGQRVEPTKPLPARPRLEPKDFMVEWTG